MALAEPARRQPRPCVAVAGQHDEHYYHGRSGEELRDIVAATLQDGPPAPDLDAGQCSTRGVSKVDPYVGTASNYDAVRKLLAAREASLRAAMETLRTTEKWTLDRQEQFLRGALRQLRLDSPPAPEVAKAVRTWQTSDDWADAFLKEFDDADLRGLGGAGIPASQKWRDVRDAVRNLRLREEDDRAYIVVNGDESEPGTFKDRELLLHQPHVVVEGVIIAGLLTEATQGFIYIRHEYPEQIAACRAAIARAERLGVCGPAAALLGRPFPVSVFVSPGGYICGEQSALIEAMSDRRGEPRNMPPKLETNGLQDLPTLVSNVETFAWTPLIVLHGGKAYAAEGVNGWRGRRLFSISGDVKRPGVYEVPMGLTLREFIKGADYCQGMAGGRRFKAFAPSGPSGGFLPTRLKAPRPPRGDPATDRGWQDWVKFATRRGFDPSVPEFDTLDLEMELNLFRAFSPTAALGAGVVVYDETRDMVDEAVRSLEFYRNESCGKCVPCRIGSQKMVSLGTNLLAGGIARDRWENELVPLVQELGTAIGMASICGLGRSVPMPFQTVIKFFPEDVARHLAASPGSQQTIL